MSDATFQIVLLSVSLLIGVLALALAARAGYRSAGRQMEVDDMLSRKHVKHVEAKLEGASFAIAASAATLLVKEGADGDTAEAEKADD